MEIEQIQRMQQALREAQLDGWLFYDFRRSNPIAYQMLQLPAEVMHTRRWFYFVPVEGEATAIISAVESHVLQSLPGRRVTFRTWQEMHELVRSCLQPGQRIAMEYSPLNAIPYVSRVDAGTVELVRSFGVEVTSSADLAQFFMAQLSPEQVYSHREAGRRLIRAKDLLFAQLGEDLRAARELNEYTVQQRLVHLIQQEGLQVPLDELPLVAVNEHSGNPHYEPTSTLHSPIKRGDFVLFDFWATLPQPEAIFADYTWVAFAGTRDEIPARHKEIFELVRSARDSAIAYIRARMAAGENARGGDVDDVARTIIARAGYADYFVHRTGHSIGTVLHGNSANVDNFETQDKRALLPSTCNSIEPGIYLPEFGVRSEVNLLILEHDAEVTGVPAQEEIFPLLS